MPEKELTFEQLTEVLNHFGGLIVTPAMMGGWKAEMDPSLIYWQGHETKACIGWGDDPNSALQNLYEVVKGETLFHRGSKKNFRLDKRKLAWKAVKQ